MMKVLFIAGDVWHPMEVIRRGLDSFGNKLDGIEMDFVEAAKDILTPEFIRAYDVIVIAKGNAVASFNSAPWYEDGVTEVRGEEFGDYLREGHGMVFLHAANCIGKDALPAYYALNGNWFIGHPLRCPVEYKVVKTNELTEGVEDFTERDEHYMLSDVAVDADIFLESRSPEGGVQAAGYTRRIGDGRVAVITPGHTLAVWTNENFQKLLVNALHWAAGEK